MEQIMTTKVHNKKLDGNIRHHFKMEWFKNYVIVMPYVLPGPDFAKMPNWNDEARLWLVMTLGFQNLDVDIGIVFDHSCGFAKCDPDHPKNLKERQVMEQGLAHLATLPTRWV
jgi:hypothetical protein